ncbi:hypothetical protein E2C01_071258 [Portunus trituberculatus]|uniref:Uncharacterized protein n=1 Tax=Portunus trituberculatus TaxID=210409 RepID=A0A5B7I4F1_PORTR|nr:hypothetical protein [Portunus trituberculatus]
MVAPPSPIVARDAPVAAQATGHPATGHLTRHSHSAGYGQQVAGHTGSTAAGEGGAQLVPVAAGGGELLGVREEGHPSVKEA